VSVGPEAFRAAEENGTTAIALAAAAMIHSARPRRNDGWR
jgi:hypothetical protein